MFDANTKSLRHEIRPFDEFLPKRVRPQMYVCACLHCPSQYLITDENSQIGNTNTKITFPRAVPTMLASSRKQNVPKYDTLQHMLDTYTHIHLFTHEVRADGDANLFNFNTSV